MERVVIIGGGPAGMMAASTARARGREVLLVEKNRFLGRKLLLTGKGRCNLTNASTIEGIIDNIVSNQRFMYSSLHTFDSNDLISFFHQLGLRTIVERGERVFPQSGRSQDVKSVLERHLKDLGVQVLNSEVKEILSSERSIEGVRLKDGMRIESGSIVLATGGLSYPATGSTGDGYHMARELGHTITPLRPSLVPMKVKEAWVQELDDLGLKNVSLCIETSNGKKVYQGFGEVYFKESSLSGPLTLTASALLGEMKEEEYRAIIDLKPALQEGDLYERLQKDFKKYSNKDFSNALKDLLPGQLIKSVVNLSPIPPRKKVHQITREERKELVYLLKNFTLSLLDRGSFEEAIITKGGISVHEIHPSTMESKIIEGLFFAGEIIDVDALTGGYNLQLAFTTGYVAGLYC